MGCCVSTNRSSAPTFQKQHQEGSESLKPRSFSHESRAPPPSIEEETVKEVLSETPQPKPPPPPTTVAAATPPPKHVKDQLLAHHQQQQQENSKKIHRIEPAFLQEKIRENGYRNFQEEEISEQEVSEVCSLSLSESVSTTTMTNDRRDDDDEEVKQRVMRSPAAKMPMRNRPSSADLVPKRVRVVSKSPTRRSEQSPSKRNYAGGGSVRLVQCKESGASQAGRRRSKPDPSKRDPCESSGRRSRSPATNRSAMGRSPSARRTNRSPGRPRSDPPENGGNSLRSDGGMESKWTSPNDKNNGTQNESLENPLVSLECFIFL